MLALATAIVGGAAVYCFAQGFSGMRGRGLDGRRLANNGGIWAHLNVFWAGVMMAYGVTLALTFCQLEAEIMRAGNAEITFAWTSTP